MRPALASPLRRLTKAEYENTIADLFGAEALAVVTAAVSLVDARAAHDFSVLAQGITAGHAQGYFQAADLLSAHVTATPARLATLAPCLASANPDAGCVRGFVERTGRRVIRRPLSAQEITDLLGHYAKGREIGNEDGVRLVLLALLQAPPFIYRPELGDVAVNTEAPQVLQLTAFELGTRLSYVLWGSTPDERLLDAAATGNLNTPAGLSAEIDRMLESPRARSWLEHFFAEWLEIEELPPALQSDAFLAGIARQGLGHDMNREVVQFALSFALGPGMGGTWKDLLTSPISFVTSTNLARIYGVPAGAGDGRVTLPPADRAGLLTRAALLVASGESTSPIARGARVRHKLLCAPLAAPDPAAFPPDAITPPAFDRNKTARQRWTEKTSAGACAGCHALLNPIGFALESYDSLGRLRRTEPILDPQTGAKVNDLPIDTNVDVVLGSRTIRVSGSAELGAALADEPDAQRCFAEQWFKFAYRRPPVSADACLMADLATAAAQLGLKEMIRRSLLTPAFHSRPLTP